MAVLVLLAPECNDVAGCCRHCSLTTVVIQSLQHVRHVPSRVCQVQPQRLQGVQSEDRQGRAENRKDGYDVAQQSTHITSDEPRIVSDRAVSPRTSSVACLSVPSPHFDGEVPLWHHWRCFAKGKLRIADVSLVTGFDNIRPDDQDKITDFVGGKAAGGSAAAGGSSVKSADGGAAAAMWAAT